MSTVSRVALLIGFQFLAGCSMTLPVTGQIQNSPETFSGVATGYMDGSGNLKIVTTAGSTCKGNFVYINSRQGEGIFHCDDGRTGPFNFVSTGMRGTGSGNLGGQAVTFAFGKHADPDAEPVKHPASVYRPNGTR